MSQIFPLLFADSPVKALLGSAPLRVYSWSQAPKDSAVPYATYGVITGLPENYMDSAPDIDHQTVQIDIWAENEDSSLACLSAIRDVLEVHGHMTSFANSEVDPETRLFRTRLEFDFFEDR